MLVSKKHSLIEPDSSGDSQSVLTHIPMITCSDLGGSVVLFASLSERRDVDPIASSISIIGIWEFRSICFNKTVVQLHALKPPIRSSFSTSHDHYDEAARPSSEFMTSGSHTPRMNEETLGSEWRCGEDLFRLMLRVGLSWLRRDETKNRHQGETRVDHKTHLHAVEKLGSVICFQNFFSFLVRRPIAPKICLVHLVAPADLV